MEIVELIERLTRKRDRLHPNNRHPGLPLLIKVSFGELEYMIGVAQALRDQQEEIARLRGVLTRLLDSDGARGTYHALKYADAISEAEEVLSARTLSQEGRG